MIPIMSWMSEWDLMSPMSIMSLMSIGHSEDESFQSITCTAANNQTQNKTRKQKKIHKTPSITGPLKAVRKKLTRVLSVRVKPVRQRVLQQSEYTGE